MSYLTIFDIIKLYDENKDLIRAYINKEPIEHENEEMNKGELAAGIVALIVILSISIIPFIAALILIIQRGNLMPPWAIILGVLLMIFFPFVGSFITIGLTYIRK